MMIEIDRFKSFNESLGHSCGDLILQKVAKRLSESSYYGRLSSVS